MTTITATLSGLRQVRAEALGEPAAAMSQVDRQSSRGQMAAIAVSIALSVAVAGYGLMGSYLAVSELAARHEVPLAGWVPAGIDGGLVAVVVLDLVLTWVGTPVGWLRQVVRMLSVGTVAANAAAGWPDPVATGLHAAAPVMLLAMIEAGRVVLLRRIGQARGMRRESIPAVRWVLAPWRTFLLWRRMALWQVTSYRVAIDTELALRRAVTLLRARYGRRWRRRAPADLVWMLRAGVAVDEACERVHVLVEVEDEAMSGTASPAAPGVLDETMVCSPADPVPEEFIDAPASSEAADGSGERFTEAVRLNRQHWVEHGRPIAAETLRQLLHVSAAASRNLARAVRAADRAAVIAASNPNVDLPPRR